ncbi:hypothetical protein PAAG_01865 [Paracoccidioides lutzii Pb01]|uniref:Uncharacterized protein n=1 Tax=Paracoccidioides lutzii (strain ATCC MYA-826 / Pb01) TaxID=502779 RepID=C1GTM0_PARBA|nr:hypothetical protein PAAG_01865 [Paracoccidioides lutzii Pb01]EEH39676.2 hypothetical protein PAAG_01865 [Paracoccidioides lutzii Pb01]
MPHYTGGSSKGLQLLERIMLSSVGNRRQYISTSTHARLKEMDLLFTVLIFIRSIGNGNGNGQLLLHMLHYGLFQGPHLSLKRNNRTNGGRKGTLDTNGCQGDSQKANALFGSSTFKNGTYESVHWYWRRTSTCLQSTEISMAASNRA